MNGEKRNPKLLWTFCGDHTVVDFKAINCLLCKSRYNTECGPHAPSSVPGIFNCCSEDKIARFLQEQAEKKPPVNRKRKGSKHKNNEPANKKALSSQEVRSRRSRRLSPSPSTSSDLSQPTIKVNMFTTNNSPSDDTNQQHVCPK